METKTKLVLIFIVMAIADMGSFILLTNLKQGLDRFEINLGHRLLGFWPMILIGVIVHGVILYYFYHPYFRSRYINYSFASFFVILCAAHLMGVIFNIHGYMTYVPPEIINGEYVGGTPAPTSSEMNIATLIILAPIAIVFLINDFSFQMYCVMDDQFKFEKLTYMKEMKERFKTVYTIEMTMKLAVNVIIFAVIGRLIGIYVDKYVGLEAFKYIMTGLGIAIAMGMWTSTVMKERK